MVLTVEHAQQILTNAPSGKGFYLSNGQCISSLEELARILPSMAPAVWAHHVTGDRNDFAAWVKGVFHDEDLALRLQHVTDPKRASRMILAVLDHVKKEVARATAPKMVEREVKPEAPRKARVPKAVIPESTPSRKSVAQGPLASMLEEVSESETQSSLDSSANSSGHSLSPLMPLPPMPPAPALLEDHHDDEIALQSVEDSDQELVNRAIAEAKNINDDLATVKTDSASRMLPKTLQELAVPPYVPEAPAQASNAEQLSAEPVDAHPRIRSKLGARGRDPNQVMDELMGQLDELELKEKKLLEVEQRIEEKYAALSTEEHGFLVKEAVFGGVVGMLVMLIVCIVLAKIYFPEVFLGLPI